MRRAISLDALRDSPAVRQRQRPRFHDEQERSLQHVGERVLSIAARDAVGRLRSERLNRLHVASATGARSIERASSQLESTIQEGGDEHLVSLNDADIQMVATVYGEYAHRRDERDRWDRIAAAQDLLTIPYAVAVAEKFGKTGAVLGAADEELKNDEVAKPIKASNFVNSWGRTRTVDPGIMRDALPYAPRALRPEVAPALAGERCRMIAA